jgi:hypothetical protein
MYVVVSHKYSYGMQIFTLHIYATSSADTTAMLRRKLLLCRYHRGPSCQFFIGENTLSEQKIDLRAFSVVDDELNFLNLVLLVKLR